MAFTTIIVDRRDNVGLITLNRPDALNALNLAMITEIADAVAAFDADGDIGAVVITGSPRAFAAGADVKELQARGNDAAYRGALRGGMERIAAARKPTIAAVAGYALGGGCELALACDIVIAGDNAKFGQPEITLGILPGLGGTQRLPRLIGKARAMDIILTGRVVEAAEAERMGLVSRMVPAAALLDEALKVGQRIATLSQPAVALAKDAIRQAFERPLADGLAEEARRFGEAFATEDQKEGMAAFVAKRSPQFRNR